MITVIKLTKQQRKDIYKFHKKLVSELGEVCVSSVYVSKEDMRLLRRSIREHARKERKKNGSLNRDRIKNHIAWMQFALEPNDSLQDVLRPGVALIIL